MFKDIWMKTLSFGASTAAFSSSLGSDDSFNGAILDFDITSEAGCPVEDMLRLHMP